LWAVITTVNNTVVYNGVTPLIRLMGGTIQRVVPKMPNNSQLP